MEIKSQQKLLIDAVITADSLKVYKMACFKRKKERDVAPTRGQFPCPAFGPHGASLSAWVCLDFFLDLFSSFLFFLCPFSLGFSIQTRYLSSIVSLDTFAHAHSSKSTSSKCQKKFGTIYHFDNNLMWLRWVNRGHLLFVLDFFKTILVRELVRGAHCKKCPMLLLHRIQWCFVVYKTREKTLRLRCSCLSIDLFQGFSLTKHFFKESRKKQLTTEHNQIKGTSRD